jgi:hypothetical protein
VSGHVVIATIRLCALSACTSPTRGEKLMSEQSNTVRRKNQGTPIVARIILIAILVAMFAVYIADIYYR